MLPETFKSRMKNLLGDEYDAFISELEGGSEVKGVRINPVKCDPLKFHEVWEGALTPIPYFDLGFIPDRTVGLGSTGAHHAGMIYVQDPGAMAALSALDIKEGWWVLDMCASPGGKATQAAGRIGKDGFLFANEFVPKRAKTIVSNIERLGIPNAIVTSLDTGELAKMFCEVFDLVICDAPCSGEGMFRKSCPAIENWSEENVIECAKRQLSILKNAPALVKEGGYLIYSTCTYSVEENEGVVDAFLEENPEFMLVEVKASLRESTADGIAFEGAKSPDLHLTRRFYPHRSKGEGQFVALMKKTKSNGKKQGILYKNAEKSPSREENEIVRKFFLENFTAAPDAALIKHQDKLVLINSDVHIPERSVFSAGVLLGEIRKGILHPHHQLFSAYGNLMKRRESLTASDPRLAAYIRGEEIEARDFSDGGYCAVMLGDAPIGGGKASGGVIKNHYPKGLRADILKSTED